MLEFLSSFCLALFTDAKLLSLVSISSLNALETVNLTSLFFVPSFVFLSFSSSFPFNLFLALCSASFLLSKSPIAGEVLPKKLGLKPSPLFKLEDGLDVES